MMIVGFCNLKGGVGKTTACQNVAIALAKKGKRIAIVDMDPQSNLSAGFGINLAPTDPQVFDLLTGAVEWDDVIMSKEGVDIVPSSLSLVMAEMNDDSSSLNHDSLRKALSKIDSDRYDYVLLDSPPQLGIFTQNVLTASDKIIVPMDGGFYSLFGLRLIDRSMDIFRQRFNPSLKIGGILMTNYNPRLYIARKIHDDVKRSFGGLLFESYIRQNVSIVEASSFGMSVLKYDHRSKGAECYTLVADEFLSRFDGNADESAPVVKPEPPAAPKEPVKTVTAEKKTEPVTPPPAKPQTVEKLVTLGAYEEGIKQDVLDLLPDPEKATWEGMLKNVKEISRGEIDVRSLRKDFEDSDKERYTFYVLNDEAASFWPVMYPDQIIEPLRCVIKWDDYGSVEVFM